MVDIHLWPYDTDPVVNQTKPIRGKRFFLNRALLTTLAGFASFAVPSNAQTSNELPDPTPTYIGDYSIGSHAYKFYNDSNGTISFRLTGETKPDPSGPEILKGTYRRVPNGAEEQVNLAVPGPQGSTTLAQYNATREMTNGSLSWLTFRARVIAGPNIDDYENLDPLAEEALAKVAAISEKILHPAKKRSHARIFVTKAFAPLKSMALIPYGLVTAPINGARYWAAERRSRNNPQPALPALERKEIVIHTPQKKLDEAIEMAFTGHRSFRLPPPPVTPTPVTEEMPAIDLSVQAPVVFAGNVTLSLPPPEATESYADTSVGDPAPAQAGPHHRRRLSAATPALVAAEEAPSEMALVAPETKREEQNLQIFAGTNSSFVSNTTDYVPIFGAILGLTLVPALSPVRRRQSIAGIQAPLILMDYGVPKNAVTHRVVSWTRKFVPELATGMAAGAAIRATVPMVAKFALAKLAFGASVAAVAASPFGLVASGIALGMFTGGVTSVLGTYLFHKEKMQEKNWRRKAFVKGMCLGSLSGIAGAIGFGLTDILHPHGWFHHLAQIKSGDWHNMFHAPQASHLMPGAHAATPVLHGVAPEQIAQHAAPVTDTALKDMLANNLVSAKEFAHLQKLVDTGHSDKAVAFCLDKARELLNTHHDAATAQKAVAFLKDGLRVADDHRIQGAIVEKIHATIAYTETWQGTPGDAQDAMMHAKLAGNALNNLGQRLMPFLRAKMPVPG